jgi:hypothetical protein
MRPSPAPGALAPPLRSGRTVRGRSPQLSSSPTVRGLTGLGTGGSSQAPWCGATAVVPTPTPSPSASPGYAQDGRRVQEKSNTYDGFGAGSILPLGRPFWALLFLSRRSAPTRGLRHRPPRGRDGARAAVTGHGAAPPTTSPPRFRTSCARPTRSAARTRLPGCGQFVRGSHRGPWRRLRPAPRGAVSRARPLPAPSLPRLADDRGRQRTVRMVGGTPFRNVQTEPMATYMRELLGLVCKGRPLVLVLLFWGMPPRVSRPRAPRAAQ